MSCYLLINSDVNDVQDNEVEDSPGARASCVSSQCNQICRKLGFAGGVCIGPNVCQCRGRMSKFADDLEASGTHMDI
jgi:hypothetical protein